MWVPDLRPAHGIDAALLPSFIPPPLRAIYELAGNYPVHYTEQWRRPYWTPGLFGTQDQLLPPDQLEINDGRFRFIHENQGVWWCETLIDHNDPPVYANIDDNRAHEVCSTLSNFLTTFCLQELVFGAKRLFAADSGLAAIGDLTLEAPKEIWDNGVYVWSGLTNLTYSYYLCGGRLMVMDSGDDYWLAYNDESAASLINPTADIWPIH